MIKEKVLPALDREVLCALGELSIYFRCLDMVLSDALALLDEDKNPRGRRTVDKMSFEWKTKKLKKKADEMLSTDKTSGIPVNPEEHEVPEILREARKVNTERNDFFHGMLRRDPETGEIAVVRSRVRDLSPLAIRSLCERIDKLAARALRIEDWVREIKDAETTHSEVKGKNPQRANQ